ncbi:MAG: hypothetical protein Q4D91_15105 [Lautropia sp.]|nr:hypothetical protein [Lautropia sp.]
MLANPSVSLAYLRLAPAVSVLVPLASALIVHQLSIIANSGCFHLSVDKLQFHHHGRQDVVERQRLHRLIGVCLLGHGERSGPPDHGALDALEPIGNRLASHPHG